MARLTVVLVSHRGVGGVHAVLDVGPAQELRPGFPASVLQLQQGVEVPAGGGGERGAGQSGGPRSDWVTSGVFTSLPTPEMGRVGLLPGGG